MCVCGQSINWEGRITDRACWSISFSCDLYFALLVWLFKAEGFRYFMHLECDFQGSQDIGCVNFKADIMTILNTKY